MSSRIEARLGSPESYPDIADPAGVITDDLLAAKAGSTARLFVGDGKPFNDPRVMEAAQYAKGRGVVMKVISGPLLIADANTGTNGLVTLHEQGVVDTLLTRPDFEGGDSYTLIETDDGIRITHEPTLNFPHNDSPWKTVVPEIAPILSSGRIAHFDAWVNILETQQEETGVRHPLFVTDANWDQLAQAAERRGLRFKGLSTDHFRRVADLENIPLSQAV